MIREKATEAVDLPHEFLTKERGHEDGRCRFCGRELMNELHDPELRTEKASERVILKREIGS